MHVRSRYRPDLDSAPEDMIRQEPDTQHDGDYAAQYVLAVEVVDHVPF